MWDSLEYWVFKMFMKYVILLHHVKIMISRYMRNVQEFCIFVLECLGNVLDVLQKGRRHCTNSGEAKGSHEELSRTGVTRDAFEDGWIGRSECCSDTSADRTGPLLHLTGLSEFTCLLAAVAASLLCSTRWMSSFQKQSIPNSLLIFSEMTNFMNYLSSTEIHHIVLHCSTIVLPYCIVLQYLQYILLYLPKVCKISFFT